MNLILGKYNIIIGIYEINLRILLLTQREMIYWIQRGLFFQNTIQKENQ
ncbi:protein of unknown function [Clostridium beijerinckii]|nr:protein of unknown function [Clostridium beijerinckii]